MRMSFILIIYLLFLLIIPVLIGIYVYRDARKRGMNAVLWTLLAVLAPSLIGFIIYLIVRGNYSNMKCPKCGTTVHDDYIRCPKCGVKLRPSCPKCDTPVQTDWTLCPKCGYLLPGVQEDVMAPVRPKDRSLKKILWIVILVPIFLIIIIFIYSPMPEQAECGYQLYAIDDYLEKNGTPEIEKWLDSCGSNLDKAYILRNKHEADGKIEGSYLVYMPCINDWSEHSVRHNVTIFSETQELYFKSSGHAANNGNAVFLIKTKGERMPKFKFYYEDKRMDCEITDVDYSLGLTDFEIRALEQANEHPLEKE